MGIFCWLLQPDFRMWPLRNQGPESVSFPWNSLKSTVFCTIQNMTINWGSSFTSADSPSWLGFEVPHSCCPCCFQYQANATLDTDGRQCLTQTDL